MDSLKSPPLLDFSIWSVLGGKGEVEGKKALHNPVNPWLMAMVPVANIDGIIPL